MIAAIVVLPLAAALWALAWREVYRRRAALWAAADEGVDRQGWTVVHGRVQEGGAVVVEIEQQPRRRGGRIFWYESARRVVAQPFDVVTARGEVVRVEPDDRVLVVDRIARGESTAERRTVVARLDAGEQVHVVGVLHDRPGEGPFRQAPARVVLRPPRRGRMLISTARLDARDRIRASLHHAAACCFAAYGAVGGLGLGVRALRGAALARSPMLAVFVAGVGIGLVGYAVLARRRLGWFEGRYHYLQGDVDDPFRA